MDAAMRSILLIFSSLCVGSENLSKSQRPYIDIVSV
jgi:hypothetical protein